MGKISDYTRVLAAKLADVFVVDQTDNGTTETKSATVEQIGTAIGTLQNFADLDTSNKNLVDAINEIASYTPVYGNTASGSIATFDTSLALPLQDCTIAINAVQESGTPTPSSPKLISGFTGANIHVADDENPHVIDNVTAISWQSEAGTVYGGYLDVTMGVLTVTNVLYTFIGANTENWANSGSYFYIATPIACRTSFTIVSNDYLGVAPRNYQSLNNFEMALSSDANNAYINIYDNRFSVLSDFIDYISNNNLQVLLKLKTPTTYQLTPTQISAIVGTNNIFTDTNGNSSVVYACSLKDYIDSQ